VRPTFLIVHLGDDDVLPAAMSGDNEELLRLFVDEAPVAIAMFDRDMRYIAASRRWKSDYGLDGSPLRGRSHYEVFPDLPEHFRARHRQGLAGEVVRHRLGQFAWKAPVELTRAPTFVEKSRLFPRTTFIIGVDTAERLFGPRYYDDDEARMHMALEEIASSGGSFLVAVRIDAAGRVRALADIPVPRRYADLFTEIPEHRFRFDTSSSEIRARTRP